MLGMNTLVALAVEGVIDPKELRLKALENMIPQTIRPMADEPLS